MRLNIYIIAKFFLLISLNIIYFSYSSLADISNYEQYMLELINRARTDTQAESTRLGISGPNEGPPNYSSEAWTNPNSSQPLIWNNNLQSAATSHSNDLADNDWNFNPARSGWGSIHSPNATYPGTSSSTTASTRVGLASYDIDNSYDGPKTTPSNYFPGLENISRYSSFPNNGWSNSEIITVIETSHNNLFVDSSTSSKGHRNTILLNDFREVGFGFTFTDEYNPGTSSTWDQAYIVQNYGDPEDNNGTNPPDVYLTGVVFNDTITMDDFYYPGEGIHGILVEVFDSSSTKIGETYTTSSGGYKFTDPSLLDGDYSVTFSNIHGDTYSEVFQILGGENHKVDAFNIVPEPSSILLTILGLSFILLRRKNTVYKV